MQKINTRSRKLLIKNAGKKWSGHWPFDDLVYSSCDSKSMLFGGAIQCSPIPPTFSVLYWGGGEGEAQNRSLISSTLEEYYIRGQRYLIGCGVNQSWLFKTSKWYTACWNKHSKESQFQKDQSNLQMPNCSKSISMWVQISLIWCDHTYDENWFKNMKSREQIWPTLRL